MADIKVKNDLGPNSSEELMKKAVEPGASDTKFGFRGMPVPSQKTRNGQKEEVEARMEEPGRCTPLTPFPLPAKRKAGGIGQEGNGAESGTAYMERMRNMVGPEVSVVGVQREIKEGKIKLEKRMQSRNKKQHSIGRNLIRHQAVLAFIYLQLSKQLGETRVHLATIVVPAFSEGFTLREKL